MRSCLWIKVATLTLVLALGFTLVSGQANQVYAASYHSGGHSGGYTGGHTGGHYSGGPSHGGPIYSGGGNYYGGWYDGGYWFAPAYPVYLCPPGYQYNPNVYNPNVYPPYCQLVPPSAN